jgi:hypothetical protein
MRKPGALTIFSVIGLFASLAISVYLLIIRPLPGEEPPRQDELTGEPNTSEPMGEPETPAPSPPTPLPIFTPTPTLSGDAGCGDGVCSRTNSAETSANCPADCPVDTTVVEIEPGKNLVIYNDKTTYDPTPGAIIPHDVTMFGFSATLLLDNEAAVTATLIAFPIYYDEPLPATDECLTNNGSMPGAPHEDRPFWSMDTPKELEMGDQHHVRVGFLYDGVMSQDATHAITWLLVSNTQDQVIYCTQQVYELMTFGDGEGGG